MALKLGIFIRHVQTEVSAETSDCGELSHRRPSGTCKKQVTKKPLDDSDTPTHRAGNGD